MKLADFFVLHRNDRRVILILLLVATIAIGVIVFAGKEEEQKQSILSAAVIDSASVAHRPQGHNERQPYYQPADVVQPERFAFDPNTADSTTLLRLGLRPNIVRNIYKYRAKGGIFRKKEDFARLYGLTVKEYRELEPYIYISPDYLPASTLVQSHEEVLRGSDSLRYPVKIVEGETVDLAMSDTTMLKTVPGVGSYYARRIVEYGRRLGGYVSVDQLDEIEDFPMESKIFFTVEKAEPQKMNINHLSLNDLKRHPYINFYQARAIIDYRRHHGIITSLDDLRLCSDFTSSDLERLRPYVEY